ncbi:MAG: pyrroline-5-carboxylate reductase [Solirubrobacterales bacterium]|nr:pyrroline-5-carboxylate reductase [Solirubrobacterales bacterium]
MKVGFAGSGNMAAAMARGWAAAIGDSLDGAPGGLAFTDYGSGRAERLAAELGGEALKGNRELAEACGLVVLAVKPAGLDAVAAEIRDAGTPVLSILGATSLERLGEALGELPVVRAMPNIPVELRTGVCCWATPEGLDPGLREAVAELLGLLGTEIELPDRLMDAATAVMGCAPAYVSLFVEALTDAGVKEGLPTEQVHLMVAETVAGTAELLAERDTLEVRRAVTSPGGTTAAGLAALESSGVRTAIAEAVEASLEKMRG